MEKTKVSKGNKLKIVCLHGLGTNKEFMKMQAQSLIKDFDEIAEFIFIDGPNVIPISFVTDPKVIKNIQGASRSWSDMRIGIKNSSLEDRLVNLEKTRKSIELATDRVDGALCFSQGSAIFQIILWAHQQKLIKWEILNNLKFFINFSADSFRVTLEGLKYKRFQIPSLHFLSELDFIFSKCIITPTLFKNPEIIFHSFGHRLPILGLRQKNKMTSFLLRHGFGIGEQSKINEDSKL